jgi:hypothetical protein
MDVWHFIFDDNNGTWTWRRVNADGEELAASDFTFQSFTVCVADAGRAGYLQNVTPHRRMRQGEERPTQARRTGARAARPHGHRAHVQ